MAEATDYVGSEEVKELSLLERSLRARRLSLPVAIGLGCSILSIALALFHLFVAEFGTPDSRSFRGTHLTVMLVLAFLLRPLFRKSLHDPLIVPGDRGNAFAISAVDDHKQLAAGRHG